MENYDQSIFKEDADDEDNDENHSGDILEAGHVYLLMKKEYRISRNVRAKWFFSHLNETIEIGQKSRIEEYEEELGVLSIIPKNPPSHWNPETASTFKYKLVSSTAISLLARRYRLVFCLDLSPSVMMVDANSGEVIIDKMIMSMQKCLRGLTSPFVIPGSNFKFTPQLYVTVIAHTSSFILPNQQVLVQGWLLTSENVQNFLEIIQTQLNAVEDCLADNLSSNTNGNEFNRMLSSRQVSYDRPMEYSYDEDIDMVHEGTNNKRLSVTLPDTSFVNLLRYGILALQLLPDNSSAGIIVVSDGIISLPDVHLFQSLLAQLRNSTVSCSFLHIGSSHHPGCCWGYESFPDLMRFIATATYGAYIPFNMSEDDSEKSSLLPRMNVYHNALLVWSFQWGPYALKADVHNWSTMSAKGDIDAYRLHYSPNHNIHFEKKQHLEKSINSSLHTLMSCRLREGYGIRDVIFKGSDSERVEVALLLPWKQDVNIVYLATSPWPPDALSCRYKVIIEGSYEFLHDLTCPAKKPIQSRYRCNVIKKFLETLQNLSQTDALLAHLHSFASNPAYYTIPDSIRSGVPLFYLATGSSRPVLCSSDFPAPKFAEFWEPICLLDINIWQKWMHTHRIGIILVHDQPLPKHLHMPNSNDRYATVQCRQALAALNKLLADWSSFVLIENHSYIKFMFGELDKPPVSFYVVRVTSKPPCMVIRLAFLGGVTSKERNEIVAQLKEKILNLTSPSRPFMKEVVGRKSDVENNMCATTGTEEANTSNISKKASCCIQLVKPVEKILIRYDRTPNDYTSPLERLIPSRSYSPLNAAQRKAIGMFSTLGRYLHHQRWVWSAQSGLSAPISSHAVARILSTLVKVRLQKGFHFAHSYSGVINMVLEVFMKGDSYLASKQVQNNDSVPKDGTVDDVIYPCVVQFVIFPPHSTSSLCESFSEEDVEVDGDATDENGELQLVTECWIEPQHGYITKTSKGTRNLEGLTYKEVPKAISLVDLECISTMLTFEHLSLMCQNSNVSTPELSPMQPLGIESSTAFNFTGSSIQQIPFPFDLMRLLPKCQQAELLFSTLTQEFEINEDAGMSNRLLLQLLQNGIAGIHDSEVRLSESEHLQFLQFLKERRRKRISLTQTLEDTSLKLNKKLASESEENETEPSSEGGSGNNNSIIHWKCYVKGVSTTHIFIIFIPATFEDLVLLNGEEHWWSEGSGDTSCIYVNGKGDTRRHSSISFSQLSTNGQKYVLPTYVYDCHLSGLIEQLVQQSDTLHLGDILQDHRPNCETGEETATIRSSDQSSSSSKHASPEPRTDETEASCSNRLAWKHHLSQVSMVFSYCFVSAIYQSLRRRFPVCCHDIQYAMEAICIETALEIDITEFLQTVCYHAKNWPTKREENPDSESSADKDNESTVSIPKGGEFPSTFWSSFSCGTLLRVHDLIRAKFGVITRRDFNQVASNQEYYHYSPPHVQKSRLKSSCSEGYDATDDETVDGPGSVEFKMEENTENSIDVSKSRPSVDLESEDDGLTSAISLTNSSVHSSVTEEDTYDQEEEENCPPLFIHLICSVSQNSNVSNCSVQTLPTCFRSVLRSADFTEEQIDEMNPSTLHITLDIVCLTLPPEVLAVIENKDSTARTGIRTTSFCSSSPVPHDCIMDADDVDDTQHLEDLNDAGITGKDPLGHLPKYQFQAINRYVDEIKWMLHDEKASFARDVHPITEEVLMTVANHISISAGRPGISANKVPLHFVFGQEQSLDKFVQEFQRMPLQGYQLIHEGDYYYLAIKRVNTNDPCATLQSSCLASKHLIVQSNPHQDDAAELGTLLHSDEATSKVRERGTLTRQNARSLEMSEDAILDDDNDDGYEENDEDDSKMDNIRKGNSSQKPHRHSKERRRHSLKMRMKNCHPRGLLAANPPFSEEQKGQRKESEPGDPVSSVDPQNSQVRQSNPRERSSSTEEEINVIWRSVSGSDPNGATTPRAHSGRRRKKSVGTGASSASATGNSTEDGYDGDSSDVDNDGDQSLDLEYTKPQLPNFWLILHISSETVDVFFQFRDAELDESQLQHRNDVNRQVILHIKNICKFVNQALLLQDLHDSRMCNQLLEPEANEDIWSQEEIVPGIKRQIIRWHSSDATDKEQFVDCQDTYLEATMKFRPGAFACPIVWETQFVLHPRIKTGQGRNVPKIGEKALHTVLSRLSVNNRNNMFVYKERNGGAVFYLRLHEIPPTTMHHLSDYSLGATRPSITEDGISLASRSSSMQSLNIRTQQDGNEEILESSRAISQEKDREQSQDTLSLSSCISSSRQKSCDDVITLSVHGICEAGSEIKEDLVQALQNRLDDVTLDVISLAFVRNPKCKLTSEDVQFIQRPGDPPKAVIHFSIQAQALPFLQVVVYYLRQNLMQFLNTPIYIDNRPENQFQRYYKGASDQVLQSSESSTAFLYIRPQEAGNRGIACIILSVVDGQENLVQHVSCPRPSPGAYKDGLSPHEYECLTQTLLHESIETSYSKRPGPVALIQFQIWEKGRVDMEQLGEKLRVTVRHALWDLATEYRFLTAPIAEMPQTEELSGICSEPSTPLKMKKQVPPQAEVIQPKERVASPLFFVQAKLRELSSSVPDLMQAKCRSPSWSSRSEYPFEIQPISPPPVPTSAPNSARPVQHTTPGMDEEIHLAMDAEVLRRQEKYELGEKGILHSFYSSVAEQWLEFGRNLGVPSVQKSTFNLTLRHSVELFLRDLQSVICTLVTDTIPKVFKKDTQDFVPFHSLSMVRDKKRVSGTPSLDGLRCSGILPGKSNCFCVIARNVKQWRASSGQIEKEGITEMAESKETDAKFYSEYQKFQAYIQVTEIHDVLDGISQSVPKGSVNRSDNHVIFIPRQRLLLLFIRDCQISLYTYNWSVDKLNKLTERSNKLVDWYNLRSCFLSSVVYQKLGLFLNQPAIRKSNNCKLHSQEQRTGTFHACKCVSFDLELLTVSGGTMLRRDAAAASILISPPQRRNPNAHNTSTSSFFDVLRDNRPQRPMRSPAFGSFYADPVIQHLGHFCETKNADTRDRQKKLLLLWQDREARASMPISLLKQISRIEHYCLTPLLFHPLWRIQVATGRDPTLTGLPPNADKFYINSPQQQPIQPESAAVGMRSRHSSGTSLKGSEFRHPRKSSIGTLVSIPSCPPIHGISRNVFPEEWHASMCSAYIGEFVQYLQTLGFVVSSHVRQGRPHKIMRDNRGKSDSSPIEDQTNPNVFPQYLQKFLLGGILLLELVVHEPYFGVKIYSFESMRLRALSNRTLNAQFVVAFLDECDKMKVSMHLHSFTYDYHLRSIHSYISGRQLALRQGYHAVGFLDEFLKYYQKSPNFARNLVHESHITISPTITSAQQLFEYLLKYDKLYDMRAMRMISLEDGEDPEYVLVQMSTRKVSYRDGSDVRQTDEFDVSLLVARDTPQFGSHMEVGERHSLSLKYFIILTSCREMFPKPVVERPQGTFRAVSTTALPPSRPPSQPPSRRVSLDRMDVERSGSTDKGGSHKTSIDGSHPLLLEKSSDSRGDMNSFEQTDTTASTLTNSNSYDGDTIRENPRLSGIRQEIVNYMGYFSTHEELMNNIMMEQVQVVKSHIQKVVDRAMVDCRRDFLWERLQKGSRDTEDSGRRKRDESKEYFYGLNYTEFTDLLRLVECKTLTDIDPRLAGLINMPINWYQTLVKVLLNKYQDNHRHFTAPDGNTQHVVILDANLKSTFMLLTIDLHSSRTGTTVPANATNSNKQNRIRRTNYPATEDLLTRTSWVDAKTALSQISKGKASGNKAALWLRTKLQAHLFHTGCFIQRHAGKVLFVGLLVLSTFCVGLKSATLETDVEKLWVEKGGRLEKELDYVQKTLGEGSGTTNQIILQIPKQEGANILRPEALQTHLSAVLVAAQVQVEMFDITWELKDLCNSPSAPAFEDHYVDQILEKLFPCVTITPLDCFWEGSHVLGPDFPVIIPALSTGIKWTTLNPLKLLQTMKDNFLMVFSFDTIDDFMKRAGITSGYQEKPCLNPLDPECPETAPNKHSGQAPDIGAELTGGCYGFATKYMHWPEDLVVGGTKKNKTGHLIKAEALQTVIQLMGERQMYEFWSDNYVVHNIDWTMEKAKLILDTWQKKFTEEVLKFGKTSNETKSYNFNAFSTSALSDILRDFSEVSGTRIALGYILMLIYACISLLRWTDPVNSQSGVGIAGVLLVAISVAAGLGLCALLGIAFNASTTQIVPFLALGLGVDDMFLLAHTYAENANLSILYEEQTGECLKRTGVSVLLTSVSNVCAFFAAAIIPVPALRAFALQAAVLVLFNVASMLLIFPAVMSLDLRRREAKRIDVFCCFPCSSQDMVVSLKTVEEGGKGLSPSSHVIPLHDLGKHRAITCALPPYGNQPVTVLSPALPPPISSEPKMLAPSMESLVTMASTHELVSPGDKQNFRRKCVGACSRTQQECYTWTLTWFARDHYGPFLQKTPVKILAVILFFALIAAGVWGVLKVTDGLDLTDIVPRNTNEHSFLAAQNKYFGFYNMFAVTQGNFEYPTNQRILYEYHRAFTRVNKIIKDDNGGLPEFWLTLFRDWLLGLQKAFDKDWRDGCITQESWFRNASDEGILAYKLLVQTGHVDNPIDKTLVSQVRLVDGDGNINSKAFYNYLSAWVTNDALAYSASQASLRPEPRQWFHDAQDVELKIPKSQPLVYTQLPFYLNNLGGTQEITAVIEEVRTICRKFEEKGLPNFPIGIPFTYWEQYLGLRFYLTLALASVLAAMFLVVSVVLMNPWTATIIVVFLAAMVIELFGFMGFVGIRLSAVPAVILIVTVGIGMEFVGHVSLGFLTSLGNRNRRMGMALEHMFAPVVHGAVSTLLGVVMLAFSQFDFIIRYFFCVLFALMVIGLLNGLLLLPVVLSLVGPTPEVIPRDDPDRIATPTPEPSPKRERSKGFKTAFNKRVHPRTNSENSLTTITEEPPSWHSSHEIVVQPEVVVETTTFPAQSSSHSRHSHSCSSDDSSPPSSSKNSMPMHGGITTKVTATTKVKVEVHTPLPGSVEREHSYRHKRRKDGPVKVEIEPDSDSGSK